MGKIAVFEVGEDPYIPVYYMDINGNWKVFQTLADTGNQRTIIDTRTARALGWDLGGDSITHVQGVFGDPQQVSVSHDVVLRIGDTEPILTSIRVADIGMNLLGWDVMNSFFTITIDGNNMIFEQKDFCASCIPMEEFESSMDQRDW